MEARELSTRTKFRLIVMDDRYRMHILFSIGKYGSHQIRILTKNIYACSKHFIVANIIGTYAFALS